MITFICGSFEEGKDGVGDYIRKLSKELTKFGREISILAISDKFVDECYGKELKFDQTNSVKVLRIPFLVNWDEKEKLSKQFMAENDTKICSIQYVPHAFHNKGLPFNLLKYLANVSNFRNLKFHIMFHELWIQESGIKNYIYREIQKRILLRILVITNASLIHTHVPVYARRLRNLAAIEVKKLPLFANIEPFVLPEKDSKERTDPYFVVGIFSQFKYYDAIEGSLDDIYNKCRELGWEFSLKFLGGKSENIEKFRSQFKNQNLVANYIKTGFLNDIELSREFDKCNIGITSVPLHLLGKSGSFSAFMAHGIPMLAPVKLRGNDEIGAFFKNFEGIIVNPSKLKLDNLSFLRETAGLIAKEIRSSNIAEIFNQDLENLY